MNNRFYNHKSLRPTVLVAMMAMMTTIMMVGTTHGYGWFLRFALCVDSCFQHAGAKRRSCSLTSASAGGLCENPTAGICYYLLADMWCILRNVVRNALHPASSVFLSAACIFAFHITVHNFRFSANPPEHRKPSLDNNKDGANEVGHVQGW